MVVEGLKPGDAITLEFPVKEATEQYTYEGRKYTLSFRGNTLIDVSPRDDRGFYPIYQRDGFKRAQAPTAPGHPSCFTRLDQVVVGESVRLTWRVAAQSVVSCGVVDKSARPARGGRSVPQFHNFLPPCEDFFSNQCRLRVLRDRKSLSTMGGSMAFIFGSLFCMLGGIGVGSFLLPLKFSKNWRWENSWLVGTFFMYVLLPIAALFILIPSFSEIYAQTPWKDLGMIYLFGLIQGTGALVFTYGTTVMGLALGYALMIGCISLFSLLVPLFGAHLDRVTKLDGVTLLIGCFILIIGIGLSGLAGLERESVLGKNEAEQSVRSSVFLWSSSSSYGPGLPTQCSISPSSSRSP